jgi:hypothetical protein
MVAILDYMLPKSVKGSWALESLPLHQLKLVAFNEPRLDLPSGRNRTGLALLFFVSVLSVQENFLIWHLVLCILLRII